MSVIAIQVRLAANREDATEKVWSAVADVAPDWGVLSGIAKYRERTSLQGQCPPPRTPGKAARPCRGGTCSAYDGI